MSQSHVFYLTVSVGIDHSLHTNMFEGALTHGARLAHARMPLFVNSHDVYG